ncbi:hypothetical protein lerEdw1_007144 [Lerista edwardsae]|nr:hypothetical protein lerEdw1_007144 [Lerista edwardsae]
MEHSVDVSGREDDVLVNAQKERLVPEDEWLQKWRTNNIAFHIEQGHPISKHTATIVSHRLADMGHSVVGVEISESALEDFFSEHNLSFSKERVPEIPGAKLFKSISGSISLYCCSIYDLTSTVVGKFDGIWDRGSLVAVNPCDRERYANLMLSLMNRQCCCLLVTCAYDPSKHKGPPFFVPESEIRHLFGKCCDIKCLEKRDYLSQVPKMWGLDYFWEIIYKVVLK